MAQRPTPYGHPSTWGKNIVLVADTLTSMGECSEAREAAGPDADNPMRYMHEAARAQADVCQVMVGRKRQHHTVVLAHYKLVSPKAETGFKKETELQKQIKRERAELEETGYYPTAVTGGVARNFVQHFPFALLTERDERRLEKQKDGADPDEGSGRILRTRSLPGYQIKCPLLVPDRLPIETGLLTIFRALKGDLFKGIISGEPGTGKTSLLCALADAGYTILHCAFEPGDDVFKAFCTPEGLERVHSLAFEDEWEHTNEGMKRRPRGMNRFESFIYNGTL